MKSKVVARWSMVALFAVVSLALGGLTAGPSYAASDAEIYIVQGLPGRQVDVSVDGKSVATGLKTASVAGPFSVKAGSRKVTFSADGKTIFSRMFSVTAKSSWDVVLHLPATTSNGEPVVTVYRNDLTSLPKQKASLVVAHTAALPPVDITVNRKVLFADVANGESLTLTVPVETYEVAIVPTGKKKPVVLGPLNLTVKGGAVNRVYAIGNPDKKTMNIALHVIVTSPTGSSKPNRVETGSGGQAATINDLTKLGR